MRRVNLGEAQRVGSQKQYSTLSKTQQNLIKIVTEHSRMRTPYMLVDIDAMRQNCLRFRDAMPDVQLYYAVKAFYSEETIRAIQPIVDGFDTASLKEIKDLLKYGIQATSISFNNPVKPEDAIRTAYQLGVRSFAFQSLSELKKINTHAPGSDVLLRIRLRDSESFVPLSHKFGCDIDEVDELLSAASKLNVGDIGITFHVGSQLLDNNAWTSAIARANTIVNEAKSRGVDVRRINIGGGFAASYFDDSPSIESAAKVVNKALDTTGKITYLAEPGRYIAAGAAVIVSKVIEVEQRHDERWIYIDTGLFQSFMGTIHYDVFPYQPVLVRKRDGRKIENASMQKWTITGPTCDSNDIVAHDIELPSDVRIGDTLIFPNTGAYTVVYGSNFNGFNVPKVRHLHHGEIS